MSIYPSGTLIANRYEVVQGPREKPSLAGGMGLVYLCVDHAENGRPVALKTFRPELLPDRAARDRFLREGTTWVELGKHPHIVRCHRVFKADIGPEVFFVLELVAAAEGKRDASLRSWLTPGKPLFVEQALLFALHIARGMRHATAKLPELVHRDLKPENLLIGREGLLRVTDFGLATVTRSSTEGGGTFLYMAPEQWDQTNVDLRADIYAFGCILFEMLAGHPAVQPDNIPALKKAHQTGQVRALPTHISTEVNELVRRCVAVKRDERYDNWIEAEAEVVSAYKTVSGKEAPKPIEGSNDTRAERVTAGWSYNTIGISYADIGKFDIAHKYFKYALNINHVEKDQSLEAAGLGNLGNVYLRLGNPSKAIEFLEQQLICACEIGDRRTEANALGNLGNVYRDLGDATKAIEFFDKQLKIVREVGDLHAEGTVLGNLGTVYFNLSDTARAIEFYNKHLNIARKIGDRHGETKALGNLGNAYLELNEVHRAIEVSKLSLAIAKEIGDPDSIAYALGCLGTTYLQSGNFALAIEYYEKQLAITKGIGDRRFEAQALGNLGITYKKLGDFSRAISLYEEAIELSKKIGDIVNAALFSFNLALLFSENGRPRDALRHAEYAVRHFTQTTQKHYFQNAQKLVENIRAQLP